MIKKFKFIGSLLLASTILFTAAGCSKTKETSTDTKNASRKIVVGMDDTFPPMEYRDEANNLKGFDIDLANELGKRLNIQFEFMPTDWNGVIQSLKSKRFDIILSALSITPEREQEIAFSRPYMAGGQIIVVKKDNKNINSREDLKGKVVGLQLGSTAEAAVKDIEGSIKQVKKYDKNTEALQDLAIGRLDAVVVDELVGRYYIKDKSAEFRILKEQLSKEDTGIGFRKEDTQLRDEFNKALEDMKNDGTLAKLSSKWLGEDITK